ncbi:hypothetical protein HPB47_016688 [Ixodes persulcatus]|uniref:Uncharacterized protein n=1 Tax=Ixodes persulcatus TaxID=34615 RepID=A0AC60QQ98_IXOPE|nr:hypothetical protein HPB47_016688 [Ixodes persulcatus]
MASLWRRSRGRKVSKPAQGFFETVNQVHNKTEHLRYTYRALLDEVQCIARRCSQPWKTHGRDTLAPFLALVDRRVRCRLALEGKAGYGASSVVGGLVEEVEQVGMALSVGDTATAYSCGPDAESGEGTSDAASQEVEALSHQRSQRRPQGKSSRTPPHRYTADHSREEERRKDMTTMP